MGIGGSLLVLRGMFLFLLIFETVGFDVPLLFGGVGFGEGARVPFFLMMLLLLLYM